MKQKSPMSLRLDPELEQRLETVSAETGIPKYTLAQWALRAVVEAAERNGYHLVVPIKLTPVKQGSAKDAPHKLEPSNIPYGVHTQGEGQSPPRPLGEDSREQSLIEDRDKPGVKYKISDATKPTAMNEEKDPPHVTHKAERKKKK